MWFSNNNMTLVLNGEDWAYESNRFGISGSIVSYMSQQGTRSWLFKPTSQYLSTTVSHSDYSKQIRPHWGIRVHYKSPWTSSTYSGTRKKVNYFKIGKRISCATGMRLMEKINREEKVQNKKNYVTNQLTDKIGHLMKLCAPRPRSYPNWGHSGTSPTKGGRPTWMVASEGFQLLRFGRCVRTTCTWQRHELWLTLTSLQELNFF